MRSKLWTAPSPHTPRSTGSTGACGVFERRDETVTTTTQTSVARPREPRRAATVALTCLVAGPALLLSARLIGVDGWWPLAIGILALTPYVVGISVVVLVVAAVSR